MRVISITGPNPELAGCDEDSGVVRKVNLPLARREFLKGSGLLFGTLVTGTLLASLAPSNRSKFCLNALYEDSISARTSRSV